MQCDKAIMTSAKLTLRHRLEQRTQTSLGLISFYLDARVLTGSVEHQERGMRKEGSKTDLAFSLENDVR